MNRRIILGIIIAITGLVLVGVGIFAIRQILNQALAPVTAPTPVPLLTEKVVVTTRDIPVGTPLGAQDLTLVDVPVELIPRNAIYDVEAAIDRMVKVKLITGEMVQSHHLADPTNISHDLAFIIDPDEVLMAFPANDLMSNLDVLQRGDLVDILVSIEQSVEPTTPDEEGIEVAAPEDEEAETVSRLFTFDAMQAIQITAIIADVFYDERSNAQIPLGSDAETQQPSPQNAEVRIRAYLLAVAPQDALVLKHLIDLGGVFDIVLRAPSADQIFDLDPVLDEYIIDRYGLELVR